MSKEAYQNALERLEEINPEEEDRDSVLAGLFIDELSNESSVSINSIPDGQGNEVEGVASQLGVTEEELNEVVDIEDDAVHFLKQPEGGPKEKMQKMGLVYLAIRRVCHGVEKCDTSELTQLMKEENIYNTRMSDHLTNYENYIRMEKENGHDTSRYKITNPGLRDVGAVISEMAEK